jgi:hypothetical protein
MMETRNIFNLHNSDLLSSKYTHQKAGTNTECCQKTLNADNRQVEKRILPNRVIRVAVGKAFMMARSDFLLDFFLARGNPGRP